MKTLLILGTVLIGFIGYRAGRKQQPQYVKVKQF